MKKIVGVIMTLCLVATLAQPALAMTNAEKAVKIQELLVLVMQLRQQLQEMQGDNEDSDYVRLRDLSIPENRWFSRFSSYGIPTDAYQAYYFDSTKPERVVKTERVSHVAINYSWSEGEEFTIDSENFGGYWIGNIRISEAGVYEISSTDGWSEARVLINGREIPNGNGKVWLDSGKYQIEVEFLNNWHTTDFAMNIQKETSVYSENEVSKKIHSLKKDFDVWYVGAYESADSDRDINLELKKSSKPVVLFLSSYSQVNWKLKGVAQANLAYIVYLSYDPGTTVTVDTNGFSTEKILKVPFDTYALEYTLEANCYDVTSAAFHCENIDSLTEIDSSMISITGEGAAGFSGGYDVSTLSVPQTILTDSKRKEILKSYSDIYRKHDAFEDSQTLDNIF